MIARLYIRPLLALIGPCLVSLRVRRPIFSLDFGIEDFRLLCTGSLRTTRTCIGLRQKESVIPGLEP